VLLAAACNAQDVHGIVKPSADVTLAFDRPGQVAEVLVREGQLVKRGELLVRLDDSAEQKQLELLKMQAEDNIRVEAARKRLEQRRVDYQRAKDAFDEGAAAKGELDSAELEKVIADLSLQLAELEKAQSQRKYLATKLDVERMRRRSPIDGRVEEVSVEKGESVEPLTPAVRVVRIDPLWALVPVPVSKAVRLRLGQAASVEIDQSRYAEPLPFPPMQGRIIHIGSVVDAASNTLRVRVEVPNPKTVPAGLHVLVKFLPDQKEKPKDPSRSAEKTQRKGDVNVGKGELARAKP